MIPLVYRMTKESGSIRQWPMGDHRDGRTLSQKERTGGRLVTLFMSYTLEREYSPSIHPDFFFPQLTFGMVITQFFWSETAFIYSYLPSAPTASQGPVFQLPIFQWKSQKHVELIPTPRNKFISHIHNLRNIFYRQSQKHVDLFNDNLAAMLPLLHLPMPTLETGSSSNENLRNVLILNRMQCFVSIILRWQS